MIMQAQTYVHANIKATILVIFVALNRQIGLSASDKSALEAFAGCTSAGEVGGVTLKKFTANAAKKCIVAEYILGGGGEKKKEEAPKGPAKEAPKKKGAAPAAAAAKVAEPSAYDNVPGVTSQMVQVRCREPVCIGRSHLSSGFSVVWYVSEEAVGVGLWQAVVLNGGWLYVLVCVRAVIRTCWRRSRLRAYPSRARRKHSRASSPISWRSLWLLSRTLHTPTVLY